MASNILDQRVQSITDMLDEMDKRQAIQTGAARKSGLAAPKMLPPVKKPSLFGFLGDRKTAVDDWMGNLLEPKLIKAARANARNVGNTMKFYQTLNKDQNITMKDFGNAVQSLNLLGEQ